MRLIELQRYVPSRFLPSASCFLLPAFCLLPIAFYVRLYLVSPIIGHDGLAARGLLPQSATWVGCRLRRHTARNRRRWQYLEEGTYLDQGQAQRHLLCR